MRLESDTVAVRISGLPLLAVMLMRLQSSLLVVTRLL